MSEDELVEKALKIVASPSRDWVTAWRELATLSDGITQEDSRFQLGREALAQCDAAFADDDWPRFQQAAESVKQIVKGT